MKFSHVAPIGLICIGGCAGVPDYRAPQPAAASTGAFVSTSPMVDATSAAPDSWWLMYDDDVLSKLVAEALEKNADLKVAVANLSISRAVLDEARAGRYPSTQTSAGVQYGRNLIADSLAASAHKSAGNVYTYLGGFDVSYEVDLFGRVARSIEAASDDTDASEAARDAVRVLVAAETTRAYTTIRSLGHELEVARRSVDLADESIHRRAPGRGRGGLRFRRRANPRAGGSGAIPIARARRPPSRGRVGADRIARPVSGRRSVDDDDL